MSEQLWVIGVVLVIIGSLGNNLGTNLISFDHKAKEITDEKVEIQKDENALDIQDIYKVNVIPHTDLKKDYECQVSGDEAENLDITVLSSSSSFSSIKPLVNLDEENALSQTHTSSEISSTQQDDCINKNISSSKLKCQCSLRNVGLFIFVTGNLLTFAAFGFAAQSLLAALESIQFVSNIAFAKYIHQEIITNRMLVATASIVMGNVLVVIFASHQSDLLTSEKMLNLYLTNTAYHCYLGLAFLLWLLMHGIFTKYYNTRVLEKKILPRQEFVEPFSFSVSSAIIGTQAVLQAKCMSILIQGQVYGNNEMSKPTFWVILFAWIFFVVFWLKRLDLGLKLYPPLFIIPVLQVFFVFFAILCGGIYFQEFVDFGPGQWIGFLAGVGMILGGVYGLAPTDIQITVKTDPDAHVASIEISDPSNITYEENPYLNAINSSDQRRSVRISEGLVNISCGGLSDSSFSEYPPRDSTLTVFVATSSSSSKSGKSPVTRKRNSIKRSSHALIDNQMFQI